MNIIAIIPARGGSKRIPYKNIIPFQGKPMIGWTIESAIKSDLFDRVVVSTDDKKIATESILLGATVPFFRESAADDISPVSAATIAAVLHAQEYWNEEHDVVVQLMPNCPIRNDKDIIDALENFNSSDSNFQLSSFKYGWMNPWWAAKLNSVGRPDPLFPEALKSRSQDLPDLFCPTGAIWIANVPALLKEETFYGENHIFYSMNWKSAVDIDDYDDLEFASAVFQLTNK